MVTPTKISIMESGFCDAINSIDWMPAANANAGCLVCVSGTKVTPNRKSPHQVDTNLFSLQKDTQTSQVSQQQARALPRPTCFNNIEFLDDLVSIIPSTYTFIMTRSLATIAFAAAAITSATAFAPSAPASRAAPRPLMAVADITNESEFDAKINGSGDSLVVVDYSTTWCGPCKVIAPKFDELSDAYPESVFLKVRTIRCDDNSCHGTFVLRLLGSIVAIKRRVIYLVTLFKSS